MIPSVASRCMADVHFPSPSQLLDNTPSFNPPCPKFNPNPAAKAPPARKQNAIAKRRHPRGKSLAEGKPKQTKSRDGCVTCKEKRLKCDETHPSCLQCKRRKVDCGGYKKTFQFRTVEKATFPLSHGPARPRRRTTRPNSLEQSPELNLSTSISTDNQDASPPAVCSPEETAPSLCDPNFVASPPSPADVSLLDAQPPPSGPISGTSASTPDQGFSDLNLFDLTRPTTPQPSIADLSLHASPTISPLQMMSRPNITLPEGHGDACSISPEENILDPLFMNTDEDIFGDVDEIPPETVIPWPYPSPPLTKPSTPSAMNFTGLPPVIDLDPEFSGLLHDLFHNQTCAILSIKNGPNENPWTTLLWPMVLDDPALYYATLSMTASHASSHIPSLSDKGFELMTKSIGLLRRNMSGMRSDTALATALVLAFAESWHSHINTGSMHLRGARNLITEGLCHQERTFLDSEDFTRLRFLENTWLYMDVIARLTALEGDDPEDLDFLLVPTYGPENIIHEIDPLMGCAKTLFPLIGAVASLIKKVRKSAKTPLQILTRAASLRDQVLKWQIPLQFVPPRDETLEIDHSRHTAEAYRWATILYLYQSVPMICTQDLSALAELTLRHLAAVPVSSRATIIHIFPLLAAGCEVTTDDDRAFVAERWEAMMNRMCIGNLDRCWDVVKEVWNRRDAAGMQREAERQRRRHEPPSPRRHSFPGDCEEDHGREGPPIEEIKTCSPKNVMNRRMNLRLGEGEKTRSKEQGPGNMVEVEPEMTVRGRLHWVAVMTERNWEILLG